MKFPKLIIKNVFISLFVILFLFLLTSSCFGASGNLGINLNFFQISISSPRPIVYHFDLGEVPIMNLSVSANRAATFRYSLREVINDSLIYDHVLFTPNTTFTAVFGLNEIIVYANDSSTIKNSSVSFFVLSSNSPPVIQMNDSQIYACEGGFLSYFFNVTDDDGDDISSIINPTYPASPFYITLRYYIDSKNSVHEIFSGNLLKSDAGGINGSSRTYLENISVGDGEYNDTASINITVIEINNAPVMENISTQTVAIGGTFFKQLLVNDTENGNATSGNLSFNISFKNNVLFNISSTGLINFVTNSSHVGSHNVTVCAIDKGIRAHPNISLCGQTGGNLSDCKNFLLVVSGCGDGICSDNENCSSCSSDCGTCGGVSGGGGGGGGSMNITYGNITFDPELVVLNLKRGETVKQSFKIRNNKNQWANLTFSLSESLGNIDIVSPNNLFIKSNEQKLFDLEFFCNETTPIGVYTGKIIVVSDEGLVKKIPVVFNVNEKDSLFDVIIYADKKKLKSGQELPFHLKLYNLGRAGIINASVEYYIKDFDGKVVIRKEENISVDTNASLKNSIPIPKGLGIGKYVIGVNFRYDGFLGVSSDTFDLVRNWMYLYIILLILFILILIIVLYVIIRRHYRRKALKSLVRT